MEKCMYKCESDGMCARSTSSHHCQQVTDEICASCALHQEKPDVNPKEQIKTAIRQALEHLPSSTENRQGREILYEALQII